jgi:arginase
MKIPLNIFAPISCGQKLTGVINGAEQMFNYALKRFTTDKPLKKSIIYSDDNSCYQNLLSTCMHEQNRINCFGGDHSMSKSTLYSSLYKTKGDMKLVWVDAYADMNTPLSSPSGNTHGMPVAYGLDLYTSLVVPSVKYSLKPDSIYYIGVRDLDRFEKHYIYENNIKMFTVDHVNSDLDSVLEEINNDKRPTHFSFDVNSLDPEFISSTETPVLNGLTLDNACSIMKYFTSKETTFHAEIVEYNPEIGNNIESWESIKELLDNFVLDPDDDEILLQSLLTVLFLNTIALSP